RLDPTLNLTWDDFPVQYISVSDAGGYFQSPDGMFVGRVNGVNWRGTFHFNYEPLLNHDPRYVIGETLLSVDRHHSQTNVGAINTMRLFESPGDTWATALGSNLGCPPEQDLFEDGVNRA